MSTLDKDKQNITEAPEELTPEEQTAEELTLADEKTETTKLEPLTLEDLELDVSEPSINFTATLHFEFSDIFNAIEHIEPEPEQEPLETEPESEPESEEILDEVIEPVEEQVESEPEPEAEIPEEPEIEEPTESAEESEVEQPTEPVEEAVLEAEAENDESDELIESAEEVQEEESAEQEATELEEPADSEPEPEPAPEPTPAKPKAGLIARLKGQDKGTKKLVLTDIILLLIVVVSIVAGLAVANSMVKKANAANEAKVAEMKANIKEVNLSESLYDMAADQVVDDVAVPTYTLDELYAMDLREKTGFTAEDLKMITRKGLVGCEEAFVKAEQTYGVNSIFLMSIASLESAYGTQMFRPNNMFGYGRTGFSSKEECIMTVAKGLGTRYLPPGGSLYGGSPTLKGVNKRYAANPQWYYKVGKYMQGYYAELAAEKNGALDKFE